MVLSRFIPVWMLSDAMTLTLAIFFAVFAVSIIIVALWYHFRQEKDVRMDKEGDEPFQLREDEREDADGSETSDDAEDGLEKGPRWVRRD